MKKICDLLRSRKGFSSAPWAVVIALAGMMFFVVLWQIVRLVTISAGVKDAVQSAVISAAVGNYANVYDGIREGYSGSSWKSAISTGDIYGRIDSILGLKSVGGKHAKADEYSVYGLSVDIENTEFAPTSGDIPQFSATSYITLEVPISFCGEILPPMRVNLCVKSKFTPKF